MVLGLVLTLSVPARAQQPSDAAGSTATAAATPNPLTVRAGSPGAGSFESYLVARTPLTASFSVADAPAGAAPTVLALDPLTAVFNPVGVPLTAGATAAPAIRISVDFGFPSAGSPVFVQPFNGGTVNGSGEGQPLTLDAAGSLSFSFQPPARAGRYQVGLRLGNVESSLRFLVYDPAATGSDRKPARPHPTH